jgi:V8-like Glu-specific endopeptidase
MTLALPASAEPGPVPHIVGGEEALPGAWPFQVAVIRANGDTYDDQFCGGVLATPRWVITAAHCVEGRSAQAIEIVAGIHNLTSPDPGYQRLAVAEIRIHPDYDAWTEDSDIALLHLATAAAFRPGQGTVLPVAGVAPVAAAVGDLAGRMSTVIGWGSTMAQPNGANRPPQYPDALHEVDVPIMTDTECRQAYYSEITGSMMCAGFKQGGKDSCQGDSGGPLLIQNAPGQPWQLAGIVSWGSGCAAPNFPGVYTRVSLFTEWIISQTGLTVSGCQALPPDEAAQCEALTVIYEQTGGPNWLIQDNWLSDEPVCDWYGVDCRNGLVSALNLLGNGLNGRLPNEIATLGTLEDLDVSSNPALAGPLPQVITTLSLKRFRYADTGLCATADAPMQLWLAGIPDLIASGQTCHSAYLPAAVGY